MTDNTQPEALRTIRRFYRGTDCMAENQAGDWVRYEDHVAALAEAQQPSPTPQADSQHARIAELEAELEAVGEGGVQALSAAPEAIAKLRHLYQNMVNGAVRDTASAKRIAEGLLAPAIEALERATPPAEQHTDDIAVDCFARALKAKLAAARAKGRGGWDTPECTQQRLSEMLRQHVGKGDPRDVANFCMFLWARGEAISPPAEQQATKETSGGFHVWRDISTAPKDGSRFVATGHNYGLYSEVRHTCVAQWFRGCWMEASDWNETSELKYLTHWMPLPSPPDDVAAPAEQQAEESCVKLLAECRDAFPIPEPSSPLEVQWSAAMARPEEVPEYVRLCVAAMQAAPKAAPAADVRLSETTDEDLMTIAVIGLNSARYRLGKGDCAGALEVVNKARDACIVAGERASAKAAPQQEAQEPIATQWLAEMIMSDCGCSTQNQRLLDRIVERITRYDAANTAPQPAPTPLMPRGDSAAPRLRAMATNYPPGHLWDKLDAKACIKGALEIEALRAALAAQKGKA